MPADLVTAIASLGEPEAVRPAAMRNVEVPDEDVLDALRLVSWVQRTLDKEQLALLDVARARGLTWREISVALDLGSEQAAQQRRNRLLRAARH